MKFAKSVLLPAVSGGMLALLLLAAFSFFIRKNDDPISLLNGLGMAARVLGALLCGLLSAVLTRDKEPYLPFLSGGMLALFQILCSLLPGGTPKGVGMSVILLLLQIALSGFTGMLLMKKGVRRRKGARRGRKIRTKRG